MKQDPKSPFAGMPRKSSFTPRTNFIREQQIEADECAAANAAVIRLQAARPLKPPPGKIAERVSRAGEIDARKAQAKGPQHAWNVTRGGDE